MEKTLWTDGHDRVLWEGAPEDRPTTTFETEQIWHRIEAATVGNDQPRRRVRAVIGSVIVGAVLGTSAVATAGFYSSRTGEGPIDAEDRRLGGPGERLDPAGDDYGFVVDDATKDIPFPDAASRKIAIRNQVDDAQGPAASGITSTGALRGWVAAAAVCAWANQWAASTPDGNTADRAAAVEAIMAAPSWSAVFEIDPEPSNPMVTMDVSNADGTTTTERFRDPTQFFYLGQLGSAVQGRNESRVAELLAENNGYCRAGLVPDIPAANPFFVGR